jgi:hypothetical protein
MEKNKNDEQQRMSQHFTSRPMNISLLAADQIQSELDVKSNKGQKTDVAERAPLALGRVSRAVANDIGNAAQQVDGAGFNC